MVNGSDEPTEKVVKIPAAAFPGARRHYVYIPQMDITVHELAIISGILLMVSFAAAGKVSHTVVDQALESAPAEVQRHFQASAIQNIILPKV